MGDRRHATELYNAGMSALEQRDTYATAVQHAYKCFASACFADPTWGTAFYQAGNNNIDLKLAHAAIACHRRALQCEQSSDERARTLCNLGWQLQAIGKTTEALIASRQAADLDATLGQAELNLSVIYRDRRDSKKSLEHARKCYDIEPSKPDYAVALAFALLFDGQYQEGLSYFERRFEWRMQHFNNYPYPRWDGDAGKQILLVADQGLGDTLSYSRFVRRCCQHSRYVHIICQHELLRLFQHTFADISNLNILPGLNQNFPPADAWTTFVSLPHALGLTTQEIIDAPAISTPGYGLPKTWKVPDRKLHVGIAWGGSPLNDIDVHRNIPIQQFYELYRVPGLQLYSLQVNQPMNGPHGVVNKWLDLPESGGAALISDLSPYIHDVVDTMALVSELDLVITAETALGHVCATLGKECWIPYSRLGLDYRAGLSGEKKLWCPEHRFFQQQDDYRWDSVFERIATALQEKIDGLD